MDGNQLDAIYLVAMDALGVNARIPFRKEVVDVAAVVGEIGTQLVEEGAHVGTLLLDFIEMEMANQFLCQVEKRLL